MERFPVDERPHPEYLYEELKQKLESGGILLNGGKYCFKIYKGLSIF